MNQVDDRGEYELIGAEKLDLRWLRGVDQEMLHLKHFI